MSVLDKVRRWIDGESAELVLEQAARDAQVKPRSQAEEFIVKIARAVEEVMQNEMVPLPQGTTIIPTEYIIFLSEEDDRDWKGIKRQGLEKGLYHVLAERAREIAGKKKLETHSFAVELRVDATLDVGEVRVQHSWEDNSSKTGVLAREKLPKKPIPPAAGRTAAPPTKNSPLQSNQPPETRPATPDFVGRQGRPVPGTASEEYSQVRPISTESEEELTAVSTRRASLYDLEIWRGGVRQNVVPVFQSEVVVGRGSRSRPVDVALGGDPEVSRRHLLVIIDRFGNFSVINEGRNPATVNERELPIGQRVQISPGQPVNICSYMIRVQPRKGPVNK